MDLGQAAFIILFVSSSLVAFARGDIIVRTAGFLSVAAAIATRALVQSSYLTAEDGVFMVDVCLAGGFILLANASSARWLGWCAGLQIMTVLTHLARMTLGGVQSVAYFDAAGIWSFPIMLLILVAACGGPAVREVRQQSLGLIQAEYSGSNPVVARTEEVSLMRDLLAASNAGAVGDSWVAQLLERVGGVAQILMAPSAILKDAGVNEKAIVFFRLCRRVTQHLTRANVDRRITLLDTTAVVEYLRSEIGHVSHERFHVLYINSRLKLIHDETQGIGTLQHVSSYAREIIAQALKLSAASIIVAHNHPSGNCTPSRDDIRMTEQLHKAASPFDIAILDHIIVSESDWKSFRVEGIMKKIHEGVDPIDVVIPSLI